MRQHIEGMANYLMHAPGAPHSMTQAREMAQGNIYSQLLRQSSMLSYLDVITVLAIGAACMVPLVFLMKKRAAAKGQVAMH